MEILEKMERDIKVAFRRIQRGERRLNRIADRVVGCPICGGRERRCKRVGEQYRCHFVRCSSEVPRHFIAVSLIEDADGPDGLVCERLAR